MLFAENGFRVIAPSRPGYLGTPLRTGRTWGQQADAHAALLDVLGINRVAVIAASGGGPSTYELAARHRDRVSALVQIDAVATALKQTMNPVELAVMGNTVVLPFWTWLLDHHPDTAVRAYLGSESSIPREAFRKQASHVMRDPAQLAFVRYQYELLQRYPERRAGTNNDYAQFAARTHLPLAAITCPTLIVHGAADTDVPPHHAQVAHAAIPHSELHWIPRVPTSGSSSTTTHEITSNTCCSGCRPGPRPETPPGAGPTQRR